MKDMKAALGNGSKPDLTHIRTSFMSYIARACEYGSDKYERANYMRPTGSKVEDFRRFRSYLRSVISHVGKTLDAMELHESQDPEITDELGAALAAYAADTDFTPGAPVGSSMLPHVAHAGAGLMMAIVQAVQCGLLPEDPGRPWDAPEAAPVALGTVSHTDGSGLVVQCKRRDCEVCAEVNGAPVSKL